MRKAWILFMFSIVFLYPCFSQNMLILGGEYNILQPDFWNASIGFNQKIINRYIQNDILLNFGSITAKNIEFIETEDEDSGIIRAEQISYPQKFIFSVRDNLFFSLDGRWIGLRAGIFALLGINGIPDFPTAYNMFLNTGGFAGIWILPKSLVSVTLDISPGYALAFRLSEGPYIHEGGFSLPLSLGIRFNFDKL